MFHTDKPLPTHQGAAVGIGIQRKVLIEQIVAAAKQLQAGVQLVLQQTTPVVQLDSWPLVFDVHKPLAAVT